MQRDEAKATELEVSVRTVQLRWARYARQGQRHHLRLLGRHGAAAAYDAVVTGFLFCGHLSADRRQDGVGVHREWTLRAEVLITPGSETATFSASRLFAAVYPEAFPHRPSAMNVHQELRA
jgi:hypothetical protein